MINYCCGLSLVQEIQDQQMFKPEKRKIGKKYKLSDGFVIGKVYIFLSM